MVYCFSCRQSYPCTSLWVCANPTVYTYTRKDGVCSCLTRTDIIGGSCHVFCRDKSMFVTTNMIFSRQNICRYKLTFVATKHIFSWQKYACGDKHVFVTTNICRDKRFVPTKIFCRDKHNFVCRDKTFVESKLILVAAPANDRHSLLILFFLCSVYIMTSFFSRRFLFHTRWSTMSA